MAPRKSKSGTLKTSSTTESSTTAEGSLELRDFSYEPWQLPVPAVEIIANPPKSLTPEWFEGRRGRLTASKRAGIIDAKIEKQWARLAEEIRTEISPQYEHRHIDSVPMRWGREHEREALTALEVELDVHIVEPGLVLHPKYGFVGSTPDGCTLDDGGTTIQVKCPYSSKIHMQTVLDSCLDPNYYAQVQWESWTSRMPNILFVSYDPRQPRVSRLAIIQVPVDLEMHARFEANTLEFVKYFDTGIFPSGGRMSVESGIPVNLF